LRLDVSRAPSVKRAAGILRGVSARLLGCIANGAVSQRGARDFAGGISYGAASEGSPAARGRTVEPEGTGPEATLPGPKPTSRGTDFLGLEEDSEVA
jgi:hypothetical protein